MIVSIIWSTSKTVSITHQTCHSHFCCWLLPIWPKLDFWAENGAYSLCWLGWRYNGAKLYFYWPYMIVSMIWNTSKTVCITPQPCHIHFCCLWFLHPFVVAESCRKKKHRNRSPEARLAVPVKTGHINTIKISRMQSMRMIILSGTSGILDSR